MRSTEQSAAYTNCGTPHAEQSAARPAQFVFSSAALSLSESVCSLFSEFAEEVDEEASGVGVAVGVGVAASVGVGVATVSEL